MPLSEKTFAGEPGIYAQGVLRKVDHRG